MHDAVGVCAHEMGDPQLALFLCTLLGAPCQDLRKKLLEDLIEGLPACFLFSRFFDQSPAYDRDIERLRSASFSGDSKCISSLCPETCRAREKPSAQARLPLSNREVKHNSTVNFSIVLSRD